MDTADGRRFKLNMKSLKMRYFAAMLALLAALVYIALYVKDVFVRPFLGDVLAVVWLYTFVRAVLGERVKHLPLKIFIFALALEAAQYFNAAQILGIQNKAVKILIGSTFDMLDILCYGIGCTVLAIFERTLKLRTKCKKWLNLARAKRYL